jgi:hypothetical protein
MAQLIAIVFVVAGATWMMMRAKPGPGRPAISAA